MLLASKHGFGLLWSTGWTLMQPWFDIGPEAVDMPPATALTPLGLPVPVPLPDDPFPLVEEPPLPPLPVPADDATMTVLPQPTRKKRRGRTARTCISRGEQWAVSASTPTSSN